MWARSEDRTRLSSGSGLAAFSFGSKRTRVSLPTVPTHPKKKNTRHARSQIHFGNCDMILTATLFSARLSKIRIFPSSVAQTVQTGHSAPKYSHQTGRRARHPVPDGPSGLLPRRRFAARRPARPARGQV